jgi:hypothetical protein
MVFIPSPIKCLEPFHRTLALTRAGILISEQGQSDQLNLVDFHTVTFRIRQITQNNIINMTGPKL